MAVKLISGFIRGQMAKYFSPHVLDATLHASTPGVRNPANLNAGTNPVATDYPCKGFVKSFEASQIDGTLVRTDDAIIVILGGTVDVRPEPGHDITIANELGVNERWTIVGGRDGKGVSSDPDGATYKCHVRQ